MALPDVLPTPVEARRIVVSIILFWLLGGLSAYRDDVSALAIVVLALAAGTTFYWTVFAVAGAETGRSAWHYFAARPGKGESFWTTAREGWKVLLRIIDPRWWHRVAVRTGWPALLVEVALVAAVVFALAQS